MEQRTRAEPAVTARTAVTAGTRAPTSTARAAALPLGVGNRSLARLARSPSTAGEGAHALARAGLVLPGVSASTPRLQRAREVSVPEDALEREADALAARVVPGGVQDRPASRRADRSEPATVARADDAGGSRPQVSPSVEALITSPGPGSAMPPAVRARIEPALDTDLSDVRVHADTPARAAAASLQARAFTTGRDVFLGEGESPHDVGLMAHEATHVVQQGAAAQRVAQRSVLPVQREEDEDDDFFDVDVTGWVKDNVAEAAAAVIPGYTVLAQVLGEDPITGAAVKPPPQDMLESLLTYGPFGAAVGPLLAAVDVLGDVVALVVAELESNDLTLARLKRDLAGAWDEFAVLEGVDGNVAILRRYIDALLADVSSFVSAIADRVIAIVREVVVDLVEPLVSTPEVQPIWSLATKVFHHDPLRDVPVDAPTVEILAEFLTLVGRTETLAQLQANGALQEAADWIDTQWGTFTSLLDETGRLFSDAWAALSPENLPGLLDTLPGLAERGAALVRRVLDFGGVLLAKALELVKQALLVPLSAQAQQLPGFTLLTVILEQDPFTGAVVERTAENLLKGFFTLVPGGQQTYEQLAESGVIGDAASRLTGEMSRLGISVDMITQTFAGIWDTLSLEDLLAPLEAFGRVLEKFGEPLSRLVEFLSVVVEVVVTLVLELMQFPSELLASILANAKAAMEDIQADPVGFLVNMLQALKAGFTAFLDNVVTHLTQGLADWLLRGLGQLGISVPSDTSLQSILDLVLQVIGVTAETLWTKLAARIGEERVAAMRGALDALSGAWQFIKDVQERGISALWTFLADKLGSLWDTLLGMAKDWIVTEIIEAAAAKLLSMLDPTGIMAVVNSFIAFFRAVQSAVEYLREILELIEQYTRTIAQVAAGDIAPGAAMLEQGLAAAVPIAIGFLASQVGLGNIPEKIVEIIQGLRQLIDEALEWLFDQAMRLGQAALNALGVGGEDSTGDPEHDAKVKAGLAAIAAAEQAYLVDGRISQEHAALVAAAVKQEHKIFSVLRVVDGVDNWDYEWAASPGGKHATPAKKEEVTAPPDLDVGDEVYLRVSEKGEEEHGRYEGTEDVQGTAFCRFSVSRLHKSGGKVLIKRSDTLRYKKSPKSGAHTMTLRILLNDAEVVADTFVSGNMTQEEYEMGYPLNMLATHTEARALAKHAQYLRPGARWVMTGHYLCCPACKGRLNSAAKQGAEFQYVPGPFCAP